MMDMFYRLSETVEVRGRGLGAPTKSKLKSRWTSESQDKVRQRHCLRWAGRSTSHHSQNPTDAGEASHEAHGHTYISRDRALVVHCRLCAGAESTEKNPRGTHRS